MHRERNDPTVDNVLGNLLWSEAAKALPGVRIRAAVSALLSNHAWRPGGQGERQRVAVVGRGKSAPAHVVSLLSAKVTRVAAGAACDGAPQLRCQSMDKKKKKAARPPLLPDDDLDPAVLSSRTLSPVGTSNWNSGHRLIARASHCVDTALQDYLGPIGRYNLVDMDGCRGFGA